MMQHIICHHIFFSIILDMKQPLLLLIQKSQQGLSHLGTGGMIVHLHPGQIFSQFTATTTAGKQRKFVISTVHISTMKELFLGDGEYVELTD